MRKSQDPKKKLLIGSYSEQPVFAKDLNPFTELQPELKVG